MSHAPKLIEAIQSCIPSRLRAVIQNLRVQADNEVMRMQKPGDRAWARKNYVNDRLSGDIDLTALHLTAKAFSAHHKDRALASVFNEMVGDLLAAGADPWLEVGAKSIPCKGLGVNNIPGKTVVEVCEGNIPPALTAWIREQIDNHTNLDGFAAKKHKVTVAHKAATRDAWRQRNGRMQIEQDLEALSDEAMERELLVA